MKFNNIDTKIFALGGLGEVGKNMYVVSHNNEIIIVDSGIMFPEDELMGIDYVIPDFTFLKQNEKNIKALIITHGHEDHIGSIPFLIQTVNIPVIYAPVQATALIKKKLEERNLRYDKLYIYDEKTKLKFKFFEIEFFRTTHSIPDSHGISIKTPNGVVVMTGDFKFDWTPIGPMSNLYKMGEIGHNGVRLLMSDSTNAEHEGMSISESKVDDALNEIFSNHIENRIIIATFASNIYRLKHIIETCRKNKRKVALFGRSMDTSIEIAMQCGYIKDKNIFISQEEVNHYKPSDVCLLCTGSQGEPLAALSRIANGTHKQIKLILDDIVVFSSSPIPGNASSVSKTINQLYLKGVKVYTNAISEIHTSGHGNQEELKLMLRLINPEYFAPYHGEYRMLKSHTNIAIECGVPKENTFVLENGDVLVLNQNGIKKEGKVTTSDVYIDGNVIGDVGSVVIKDRKLISNNGLLVVIYNIDCNKNELIGKINITTRGFIVMNENEELIRSIEKKAETIIKDALASKHITQNDIKNDIVTNLAPFLSEKTGRTPIILPIMMSIKNSQ